MGSEHSGNSSAGYGKKTGSGTKWFGGTFTTQRHGGINCNQKKFACKMPLPVWTPLLVVGNIKRRGKAGKLCHVRVLKFTPRSAALLLAGPRRAITVMGEGTGGKSSGTNWELAALKASGEEITPKRYLQQNKNTIRQSGYAPLRGFHASGWRYHWSARNPESNWYGYRDGRSRPLPRPIM